MLKIGSESYLFIYLFIYVSFLIFVFYYIQFVYYYIIMLHPESLGHASFFKISLL